MFSLNLGFPFVYFLRFVNLLLNEDDDDGDDDDFFMCVLIAFVALGSVSSVLSYKRLASKNVQNDLFRVEWDVGPRTLFG